MSLLLNHLINEVLASEKVVIHLHLYLFLSG